MAGEEIVEPRSELIDTSTERVLDDADALGIDDGSESIVAESGHRDIAPGLVAHGVAVTEFAREKVVSVDEDVRLDRDPLADDGLCGITAAVDFRRDVVDDEATWFAGGKAASVAHT